MSDSEVEPIRKWSPRCIFQYNMNKMQPCIFALIHQRGNSTSIDDLCKEKTQRSHACMQKIVCYSKRSEYLFRVIKDLKLGTFSKPNLLFKGRPAFISLVNYDREWGSWLGTTKCNSVPKWEYRTYCRFDVS